MKLKAKERMLLSAALPKEGTLANLKLIRVLKEELSFSEEEHKALNIHQEGDMLLWNFDADYEKEIEIGDTMKALIVKNLNLLNKQEKLTEDHIGLCEMFGYTGEE